MKLSRSIQAFIPAVVLTALVLFVFSTLQNYGPESAVRRFHEGILRRDMREINEVTMPANSHQEEGEVNAMARLIYGRLNQSRRIRLQDMQRSPKAIIVTVLYYTPDGAPLGNAPYVAVKTQLGWRVDVHRTWQLWNSMFRPVTTSQGIN
jgi:hypothetical protein